MKNKTTVNTEGETVMDASAFDVMELEAQAEGGVVVSAAGLDTRISFEQFCRTFNVVRGE